jgi:Arc/MetJ-type ribon-helix-helix transcriptional regulator
MEYTTGDSKLSEQTETEDCETLYIPQATVDEIKKQPFFKLFNSVDEFVRAAIQRRLRELQLEQTKQSPESKKSFGENLQLITLQIQLAKPFVDFIEDYRRYFGCEYSTELICMSMIYSQVKRLFNELDSYARKKDSFLRDGGFFKKHLYLGSVCFDDPEDETE